MGDKVTIKEDEKTIMYNKSCIYELQRNKEGWFGFQKVDSKLNDLSSVKQQKIYSQYFLSRKIW